MDNTLNPLVKFDVLPIKFDRKIVFTPAYDHTKTVKGGGCHGVEMAFIVKSDKGAISFTLLTNWMLPETYEHWGVRGVTGQQTPMPSNLSIHSYEPMSLAGDYIVVEAETCPYLDATGFCKVISYQRAQQYFDLLVKDGDEAMWLALEKMYVAQFHPEATSHAT